MKNVHAQQVRRIDQLMDHASRDLVAMKYFDAETACLQALERAYVIRDYERMARILLPLEECRRQKRDLAFDTGAVHIVAGQLPAPGKITPGMYLVCPPRVGIDGRELRERADRRKVPAIVVVREPTSRDGLWPVVSIGPVTVRTKVPPPTPPAPPKPSRSKKQRPAPPAAPPETLETGLPPGEPMPTPAWFLHANEAIGDAAVSTAIEETRAGIRVDLLMARLTAHPDHEKLHQVLADACRAAMREPIAAAVPEDGSGGGVEDDGDGIDGAGGEATSSYRGRSARSGHR